MNANKNTTNFQERPEGQLGRNHFDMSYPHIDTFSMGELVPFFWAETMPNDYWEIKSEHFYRFPPSYKPFFHRINSQIAYFYIPNRIIWPGKKQDSWEWFIRDESSVEAPYFNFPVDLTADAPWRVTTIVEHFGLPSLQTEDDVSIETIKLNALIIFAYLMIYDEYYRNDQIQSTKYTEPTGGDNTTALAAAFNMTSLSWRCLRRNWNRDYYTSATPTPQVGNNVLVPMMRNDTVDQLVTTWTHLGPTMWKDFTTNLNVNSGSLNLSALGTQASGGEYVYLDVQETAASIRDLRFALMLTEYLEKLMRLGDRYRDFIKGMWKVDPFPLLVDRPLYLGGGSGLVAVSEVMSHTNGDSIASTLGAYAGQSLHMDQSGKIRYHCMEHGFIIGIVSVYPKSMYFQGLNRMWTRTTKYDYPLDAFNFIGDDALLNKEVMLSYLTADQNWNNEIFGYIPRYSDWRYRNAVVSGQFRDSQGSEFSWHLGRFFDVNASDELLLNDEFLQCYPAKSRVFIIGNPEAGVGYQEEEVKAYIWNEAHVKRQLSKFGIPGL